MEHTKDEYGLDYQMKFSRWDEHGTHQALAVGAALEAAAKMCEEHVAATVTNANKATHAGLYILDKFFDNGGCHQGMAYAQAIRDLIPTEYTDAIAKHDAEEKKND